MSHHIMMEVQLQEDWRQSQALVDKLTAESNAIWNLFNASRINYKSMFKINGQHLPSPVMTFEKKRKISTYKKQATIVEVTLKYRMREKEFLNKVQDALDETMDYRSDATSSVDDKTVEMPDEHLIPPLDLKLLNDENSNSSPRKAYHLCNANSNSQDTKAAENISNSNGGLALPFSHYERSVTSPVPNMASRQRYRDAKVNAARTASPQLPPPTLQPEKDRPHSTPPVVMTINSDWGSVHAEQCAATPQQQCSANQQLQKVSSKALRRLLENVDPSNDRSTHQWLVERVSGQALDESDGEISLEDWFQNAPDSVKQKLVALLPLVTAQVAERTPGSHKSAAGDIYVSVVHTCDLSDDTLHSTSPISNEENASPPYQTSIDGLHAEEIIEEESQLIVVDRSPRLDSQQSINSSHTASTQITQISPHKSDNTQTPATVAPAASVRKKSVFMRSYTLDEPSIALLNSTLHDESQCSTYKSQNTSDKSANRNSPINVSKKAKLKSSNEVKRQVNQKSSKQNCGSTSMSGAERPSSKQKSRIPKKISPSTPKQQQGQCKSERAVRATDQKTASKSTKSPVVRKTAECKTPSSTSGDTCLQAKHKLLQKVLLDTPPTSLTPTPPDRILTPTPPERPRSETGTRWSRARSGSSVHRAGRAADDCYGSVSQQKSQQKTELKPSPTEKTPKNPILRSQSFFSDKSDQLTKDPSRCANVKVETIPQKPKPAENEGNFNVSLVNDRMDRLAQARRQLALLKAKFASKLFLDIDTGQPKSDSTVLTSMIPKDVTLGRGDDPTYTMSEELKTESVSLPQPRSSSSPSDLDGKENWRCNSAKSRNQRGVSNRDELAIATAFSVSTCDSDEELSTSAYSQLGGILSESSLINKAELPSHTSQPDPTNTISKPPSAVNPLVDSVSGNKLAGLVRGFLTRKLLHCSKVKSIVRTVQDCENLLGNLTSFRENSSIHDKNFQRKLKQQMVAAKEDLHNIFFNFTGQQKMSLIRQSERVLARQQKYKKADKEAKSSPNSRSRSIRVGQNKVIKPLRAVNLTAAIEV